MKGFYKTNKKIIFTFAGACLFALCGIFVLLFGLTPVDAYEIMQPTATETVSDALSWGITLNHENGTGETAIVVTEGECLPDVDIPVKEGYTFQGYYTGTYIDYSAKYIDSAGVGFRPWYISEDHTRNLYACYTEGGVTAICYDPNYFYFDSEGDHMPQPTELVELDDGNKWPTSLPCLSREGLYWFEGYYDRPVGGTQYYDVEGRATDIISGVDENGNAKYNYNLDYQITLYAQWSEQIIVESDVPDGDGSSNNPYLIKSAQHLAWIAEHSSMTNKFDGKYFKQMADIDLDKLQYSVIDYFNGYYDGNGYSISNLYSPKSIQNTHIGLFGECEGATLNNIIVTNGRMFEVQATDYGMIEINGNHGGIVGKATDCIITNCYNGVDLIPNDTASMMNNNFHTGGIVGLFVDSGIGIAKIENCTNMGSTYAHDSYGYTGSGGIIGQLQGTSQSSQDILIKGCINFGAVNGYCKVGGIIGRVAFSNFSYGNEDIVYQLELQGCISYSVRQSGNSYAPLAYGCLIGDAIYSSKVEITQCANFSAESAVGDMWGTLVIKDCYNCGKSEGSTNVIVKTEYGLELYLYYNSEYDYDCIYYYIESNEYIYDSEDITDHVEDYFDFTNWDVTLMLPKAVVWFSQGHN
ncbi:MAG: hypothetical protein J6A28_04390 [Clostridia bacterium]|nr:hypothetical protein [Clostridia bacterium]